MTNRGVAEKQTQDQGKFICHISDSETGQKEGEMFCNPVYILNSLLIYIVSTVFFTHEYDLLGVAITVYRMWLKTLIHVLTFFPHSVHKEFVFWLMALTMIGSIWPRLPMLLLTVGCLASFL